MKLLTLSFAVVLTLTACGKSETQQIGTPSLAGIPEKNRPQAEAAFQHAKRFIATAAVDTAKLDLSKPQIFQRPNAPPPRDRRGVYDWWVSFSWATPSEKPPYGISIAVTYDGTCWILE